MSKSADDALRAEIASTHCQPLVYPVTLSDCTCTGRGHLGSQSRASSICGRGPTGGLGFISAGKSRDPIITRSPEPPRAETSQISSLFPTSTAWSCPVFLMRLLCPSAGLASVSGPQSAPLYGAARGHPNVSFALPSQTPQPKHEAIDSRARSSDSVLETEPDGLRNQLKVRISVPGIWSAPQS